MYVKDLRATTDRDSLLDLFDRARQVGFNVDRLQITNMHLHIRASVASTGRVPAGGLNDPAIGLAYLEMREVRSDMTPAQVAASMVSLREQTRVTGSEAEVVSMAVRVEQRLNRTHARLRTMDVRRAALRVVRQLEVSLSPSRNSRSSLESRSSSPHGRHVLLRVGSWWVRMVGALRQLPLHRQLPLTITLLVTHDPTCGVQEHVKQQTPHREELALQHVT